MLHFCNVIAPNGTQAINASMLCCWSSSLLLHGGCGCKPTHRYWPVPNLLQDYHTIHVRGKGPGYSSHGYLPISRAYATDICLYPAGGSQTLTLTEEN